MFSDCSGECCVCACGNGCLAGHGDDDFFPASNQQIIERLNNGEYPNYRKTMIAELAKRGIVYGEQKNGRMDKGQREVARTARSGMSRQKGDIMREVLISIQPKWVEKIVRGEKTVEVRKTKPKIETPFRVYIYCTADRRKHIADTFVPQTPLFVKNGVAKSSIGREDGLPWKLGNGKVIGEFVCDRIVQFENSIYDEAFIETRTRSCVPMGELLVYLGVKDYGYGWHITDLVVYDEPRELSDFYVWKKCNSCRDTGYESTACCYDEDCRVPAVITRPPQSWCYIEPRQTAD